MRRGRPPTHGHYKSLTYVSWQQMKARCRNPKTHGSELYLGRGITVCSRWQAFENFLADMGERPVGMTLDRKDPDGNYEPGNCQWATPRQQQQNRRDRLKPAQVADILERLTRGESQKDIALVYQVTPSAISHLQRREVGYQVSITKE